ncbi:hypothetical protein G6M50_30190 [Agrobacterium rhizogenes]|nr:hypothetical protein [Rhizobium rhizogenes]NTJ82062.1 hypothetical protein [Rhizobium rhizogenes]
MKRTFLIISFISLLAGCTSTSTREDMQKDPTSLKQTQTFSEDYQLIYERISKRSEVCSPAGTVSQLYPEKGFGQVDFLNTYSIPMEYLATVKIEKAGSGSKVSIASGNNWAKQKYIDDILRWASGDTKCTKGWII